MDFVKPKVHLEQRMGWQMPKGKDLHWRKPTDLHHRQMVTMMKIKKLMDFHLLRVIVTQKAKAINSHSQMDLVMRMVKDWRMVKAKRFHLPMD